MTINMYLCKMCKAVEAMVAAVDSGDDVNDSINVVDSCMNSIMSEMIAHQVEDENLVKLCRMWDDLSCEMYKAKCALDCIPDEVREFAAQYDLVCEKLM